LVTVWPAGLYQASQPVRVDDVRKDKPLGKDPAQRFKPSERHCEAPLIVAKDVIGAILVFHRKVGYFSPEAMKPGCRHRQTRWRLPLTMQQLYHLNP